MRCQLKCALFFSEMPIRNSDTDHKRTEREKRNPDAGCLNTIKQSGKQNVINIPNLLGKKA